MLFREGTNLQSLLLLLHTLVIQMDLDQSGFFGGDLFLQLVNLVVHNLQLSLHLSYFIL